MKIKNPNYKKAGLIKAEKATAKLAQFVNAQPANVEFIDFDTIRAEVDAAGLVGVTGADLADGYIEYLAGLNGLEVSHD